MTPHAMALHAALSYTQRGWLVFPTRADKRPRTEHGLLDATIDEFTIREWWGRWPNAIPAIATGERSGVVALDIDLRNDLSGFDTLDGLGVSLHPRTPTAHTPRGGCHLLFGWPGHFVKTVAGALGPALDIRADGGSLMLPPGPGRWWDPHLGLNTPLLPMPQWMVIAEPEPTRVEASQPLRQSLSPYGENALDSAVKTIVTAPAGEQHNTLNRETYDIARLVAGGVIPAPLALEGLRWAAGQMPSHDRTRPWSARDLDKMVSGSFLDGLRHPRRPKGRR